MVPQAQAQESQIRPEPIPPWPHSTFDLGLVLAKESILINSYQPRERRNRLPFNLLRLPILEEFDSLSMNVLVSKARKPKFDLVLKLIDLNNVPLTSGTAYIKWSLPATLSSEHSGQTDRSPIKEHKVIWDYSRTIPVRLTIDKNDHLSECLIHFEIIQEYNFGPSTKSERVTLGHITLNLSEYVDESEVEGEDGVIRRYLMQESKINSTAKIGIAMRQTEGDRNFVAPTLKSAPVFGGIAGIIMGENGDGEDIGHMPQLQNSSDKSDLHDMYRRALAASWTASPAEMPADECVEDIFAGGDGWKRDRYDPKTHTSHTEYPMTPRIVQDDMSTSASVSGGSGEDLRRHKRIPSDASQRSNVTAGGEIVGGSGKVRGGDREGRDISRGHRYKKSNETTRSGASSAGRSVSAASGVSSSGLILNVGDGGDEESIIMRERSRQARGLGHIPGMGPGYSRPREVDELDVREDLVAWKLSGCVS